MSHSVTTAMALLLAAQTFTATNTCAQSINIPMGAGSFSVPAAAPDGSALKVWTYRPRDLRPDDRIVVVMHGVKRNARTYRDGWIGTARAHRLLVLAPEMTQRQFPGNAGYSQGNMVDRKGQPQPPERLAWHAIELVFDAARTATGSSRQTYALYGHSAGAQFVHRFVMFADKSRVDIAISANAGWYTMPVVTERFPYGLGAAPVDAASVRARFAVPLVVLLGGDDTDPEDANLRRTPAALRQGENRLARGHHFFRTAEAEAKASGLPFAWTLEVVPGVDHDSRRMMAAAVAWILGQRR